MTGTDRMSSTTGTSEWYTPQPIVSAAAMAMGGIDLDPCSCEMANRTVKADKFFTVEDSGLLKKWYGNVWMNPPYARRQIELWIDKMLTEKEVDKWICLVNNATDTKWGQRLLHEAGAVCFLRGRIKFTNEKGETPKGSPTQGQMVVASRGVDFQFFRADFMNHGRVVDLWGDRFGEQYTILSWYHSFDQWVEIETHSNHDKAQNAFDLLVEEEGTMAERTDLPIVMTYGDAHDGVRVRELNTEEFAECELPGTKEG